MPTRYHHDSVHGPGTRRPLDRNDRAAIRYVLKQRRRRRLPGEAKRPRISVAAYRVGLRLLDYVGHDGRCDPSHVRLANDLDYHEDTIREAIRQLHALGLLRWERRLVLEEWPGAPHGGRQARQTSNAYTWHPPATLNTFANHGPAFPGGTPQFLNLKRRPVRETAQPAFRPAPPNEIAAARMALEEVKARRAAVIAQQWRQRAMR